MTEPTDQGRRHGALRLRRGLLVFAIEGSIIIALAAISWVLASVLITLI